MNPEFRDHRNRMISRAVYEATGKACDSLTFISRQGHLLPVETETEILLDCLSRLRDCIEAFEMFLPREKTAQGEWKFKQSTYTAKPLLDRQCRGTRTDGKPCRIRACSGSLFCRHHRDQETALSRLGDIVSGLSGWEGSR